MMAAGIRSAAAVRAAAAARGLRLFGDLPAVRSRKLTPYPTRLHNNSTQIDSRTRNHDFRVAYPLSWTKTYSTTCSICNPSSPCNDDDATRMSTEKVEIDAEAASATMDGSFRAIEFSMNSVVKIFTISLSPCDVFPWQIDCSTKLTGSGFVISGRRILTNAHVVADHKFIQVRKHGSPTKYKAEVQAVGHECDLAILTVDSEDFWKGINFLEFGHIPFLQSSVSVVGYPIGGDNICVTKGVVSRIEQIEYCHVKNKLLAIQIDAAINGGNSGGPALMGEKVVGVAFQGIESTSAENIGHIIPVPVIKHFISGVEETGGYVGFCSMDIVWQPSENEQLLEHYKMPPGATGVRVSKINKNSGASSVLKVDDIILSFDGSTIANDGTVQFRNRDRIEFDHFVTMKKPNDTAMVKVLRGGVEHELSVTVRPKQHLVPLHQYDTLPSYYIFAGLIFVPLTQTYYGDDWTDWPENLYEASRQPIRKDGQQIIIISKVLVDDINIGYDAYRGLQVRKVNGVVVDNLKHLRELVEDGGQKESVRFDIDDKHVIVLNYSKAKMANSRILKSYRIHSAMSDDLVEKQSNPDMEFAFAS